MPSFFVLKLLDGLQSKQTLLRRMDQHLLLMETFLVVFFSIYVQCAPWLIETNYNEPRRKTILGTAVLSLVKKKKNILIIPVQPISPVSYGWIKHQAFPVTRNCRKYRDLSLITFRQWWRLPSAAFRSIIIKYLR